MGDSGLVFTSLTSLPVAQPHSSVDDGSLYKHINYEPPDRDHARQLIILCTARGPLPAPREGKDPPGEPSDKGAKLSFRKLILRVHTPCHVYTDTCIPTSLPTTFLRARRASDTRSPSQGASFSSSTNTYPHRFRYLSAPEEDYVSIHIHVVGDFIRELPKRSAATSTKRAEKRARRALQVAGSWARMSTHL